MFGGILFNPAHKGAGFFLEADAEKCVDGKRCVAHPGVSVVPVALSSDYFRQTGRWRSDDGSGRLKSQQLERQRRTVDLVTPAPAISALREPLLPEPHGIFK